MIERIRLWWKQVNCDHCCSRKVTSYVCKHGVVKECPPTWVCDDCGLTRAVILDTRM